MELVTKAEFARRVRVSKPAIGKAIKNSRLRVVGEGRSAKIDLHDGLSINYMNDNSPNRQVAQQSKDMGESSKNETTPNAPKNDRQYVPTSLRDEKLKIETAKLKIEMAQRMGELVLRSKVEEVFAGVSSSIISYIFPLGDRLSPLLASVFESTDQDKINEVKREIDKEVARALESVKRDVSDSLMEFKQ